jgi:hypothetical protein
MLVLWFWYFEILRTDGSLENQRTTQHGCKPATSPRTDCLNMAISEK